jgi:hypothetical protein
LSEDIRDETAAPPSLDSKVNVFGLVKQGKVGVSRCSVAPTFPVGASGPANCRSIACIELQLAASRAWHSPKPNRATTAPLRDSRELGSSENRMASDQHRACEESAALCGSRDALLFGLSNWGKPAGH